MIPDTHGRRGTLYERSRLTVLRVLTWQLATALAIAALLAIWVDGRAAYSALTGAFIGVAPNYYLAGRMLRRRRFATAEESLRAIYTGEFLKIAFTAALFVIAIMFLNVSFVVVVGVYVATVVVNWIALLFVNLGEADAGESTGQATG